MNFQQAQNWIFPWEEVNCPDTGQNSFVCLQARTVCITYHVQSCTKPDKPHRLQCSMQRMLIPKSMVDRREGEL